LRKKERKTDREEEVGMIERKGRHGFPDENVAATD